MTLPDFLLLLSTIAYFGGGVVGWLICWAARNSRRYHPAITYTGLGIGMLPTYLFLLRILRAFGLSWPLADIWQLLATFLVVTTVTVAGVMAFYHVVVSNRAERRERLARTG
jgi:fatty-acid desaturase